MLRIIRWERRPCTRVYGDPALLLDAWGPDYDLHPRLRGAAMRDTRTVAGVAFGKGSAA